MLRKRKSQPKTRTGCFSCKKAHVRCTENRPQCHRCTRLSLDCSYGVKLLWEDDAAQRNIAHGRAGIWSREGGVQSQSRSNRTCTSPIPSSIDVEWSFRNFGLEDFKDGFSEADDTDDETPNPLVIDSTGNPQHLEATNRSPVFELTTNLRAFESADKSVSPHLVAVESDLLLDVSPACSMTFGIPTSLYSGVNAHLLNYYINELCPKCSLSPSHNPYLSVLLPIAYEFSPLRNALLAVAANQLRLSNDHRFEASALTLKSAAIRDLRHHLATRPIDWKSLATMVMFCFYDISDDCAPSWVTHLRMGMGMLLDLETQTRTDDDLKRFCEIYFVTHDVMARTGLNEGHVETYTWIGADHQEIDPLMGCSRELISIISEISSLAAQSRDFDEEIMKTRDGIKDRLSKLQQYPSKYTRDPQHLMQIAEAKRLAATLYLEQRVPSTTNLRNLICSIINTLRQLPASASSLWPLFVLGNSELETEAQRRFVLGRFHQLEETRKLGHIHHAKRLVEQRMIAKGAFGGKQLHNSDRWISLA